LADRWVSSAIAYRCAEDPSLRDYVLQVNSVFAKPVLTILLDIPAEESIARGLNINKNNYSVEFLARVRAKYLEMAEEFSFKVIDAKQPYEVLRQQVMDLLRQRLIEWGYSLDLSPRNLGRGG
jgi:thymidylate kinase